MVVICEECGKIYHLDPLKLKEGMKKEISRIKCRVCDHVIEIKRSDGSNDGNLQNISPEINKQQQDPEEKADDTSAPEINLAVRQAPVKKGSSLVKSTRSGLGLEPKCFFYSYLYPFSLLRALGFSLRFRC